MNQEPSQAELKSICMLLYGERRRSVGSSLMKLVGIFGWGLLYGAAAALAQSPGGTERINHPSSPDRGNVSKPTSLGVAQMQRRADLSYRKAIKRVSFIGDHDDAKQTFERAEAVWNSRVAACRTAICKVAVLDDFRNRANFVLGRPAHPIKGIPWSRGSFAVNNHELYGDLVIFPLIDNQMVIGVTTADRSRGAYTCEFVAYGKLGRDGFAEMETLDAASKEPGFKFGLKALGREKVQLRQMVEEHSAWCGLNGSFFGTYRMTNRSQLLTRMKVVPKPGRRAGPS